MHLLRFYFLLFFGLSFIKTYSQGTINVPKIECLGNITNFSYTPPSGLTLSSAQWNFGDGFSSSNVTPVHAYASTGKFTIIVQATFTNSSVRTDSTIINVVGLPKSAFYFYKKSDTCLSRNSVCYIDTSSPNTAGQTIKQRLLVWGDGGFTLQNNPKKGDTICHYYAVPDKYNLKLEVTDTFGCKHSSNAISTVLDDVLSGFSSDFYFVNCSTANVCLLNKSQGSTPATSHFRWLVDGVLMDTGSYFNSSKCFSFTKTKNIKFQLVSFENNLCRDTFTKNINVVIDSLPTFFELDDTLKCYGDNSLNHAFSRNVNREISYWYLDNSVMGTPPNITNEIYFETKLSAGKHTIRYSITRGNCVHSVSRNFTIMGPIASITAIDGVQCFSNREVYLVENVQGSNKANLTYHWYIDDPKGDNCIAHRTKGINLYKNCNEALDWYTKHKYPKNSSSTNAVSLKIVDTLTGCHDTTSINIDMKNCSKILDIDTFTVCQGDLFLLDFPLPAPKKFTIDSGRTWVNFPSVVDKPLLGFYEVGFIFETELNKWAETIGNDSIKIYTTPKKYYDTIFRKQLLHIVTPKKDSAYVKFYNSCSPFFASVHFDTGKFKAKEKLLVVWGDIGNVDIEFKRDTAIDSVTHLYKLAGFSAELQIFITDENGCINRFKYPVDKGKALSYNTPKFINCKNDVVCFYPGVYDFSRKLFWDKNTQNNKVRWRFPDTSAINNDFKPCAKFTKGGLRPFEMIVSDSLGCIDTLRDSVFVQDVRAGIKEISKIVYCSELKQFFDSSSRLVNPAYRYFWPFDYPDTIKQYSWQFGDGTFSSLKKDPLQALNTSLEKIKAAHVVETVSGCTDTIRFDIQIIGPKPYFLIPPDTIGCGSLNARFINLSRNSKSYVWQFGDSANTTLQKSDKGDVSFNYTKPGRYYISLIGIDTVFNPITNSIQYCYNTFPDKLFQKDTQRSVLVLPFNKTGITAPDTICVNVPFELNSLSDTAYNKDIWSISDNTFLDTLERLKIQHVFKSGGTFVVKLNPYYNSVTSNRCRDSASKTIVVMDVLSNFDVAPDSKAPLFKFNNTSLPVSAKFLWDFDVAGAAKPTTFNAEYNYGMDTGEYNVCLIASIPYGCMDTFCRKIYNDYLSGFKIPNVFTPGLLDDKNDKFDVMIEGETTYSLEIYDRWGVKVYESDVDADNSNNSDKGNWNGKYRNTGEDCSSGTYYYLLQYTLKSDPGVVQTVQGTVTLIR